MKRKSFVAAFFLSLIFAGSAPAFSPRDVVVAKQSGDQGITMIYRVNKDQAWEIVRAVLRWQHSNKIEDHLDQDYVLTSIGIVSCPCRTEVGVWVEPLNDDETKITIITRGRSSKNLFTNIETFPDTIKPDFHMRFRKAVDIVKSGKELPFTPP